MTVRTRFAPSPTGYLHIGGARTALFSWLYARKHGGRFVLRIEDTDLERSSAESVNAILEGMTWLGLEYDEGPFYQTERFDRYKKVIQQLLDQGDAYYCYCSREELDTMREQQMVNKQKPRYNGKCRDAAEPRDGVQPVVRFRNPADGEVVVDDLIKGKVVIKNRELDDLVIARPDGSPTYNLTVVVDDADMKVDYVIRGDDHLNNTPRQINILKALKIEPPKYAHLPMILGGDGKRLSKRHGAVGVMSYRDEGYMPEALLNYLVRLGWSHGDQEVFSLDEMISLFSLEGCNKAASTFNQEKLLWLNHQYIMNSDPAHVAHHLSYHLGNIDIDPSNGPDILDVIKAQCEKAKTLVDLAKVCEFYYRDPVEYNPKSAKKAFAGEAANVLAALYDGMGTMAEWSRESIHATLQQIVDKFEVGFGKVGMPARLAVTGGTASPDLDLVLYLLGQETCRRRFLRAIEFIKAG